MTKMGRTIGKTEEKSNGVMAYFRHTRFPNYFFAESAIIRPRGTHFISSGDSGAIVVP